MAAFRKGHVKVVRWLVKHVTQFPSDTECMRYIATITDKVRWFDVIFIIIVPVDEVGRRHRNTKHLFDFASVIPSFHLWCMTIIWESGHSIYFKLGGLEKVVGFQPSKNVGVPLLSDFLHSLIGLVFRNLLIFGHVIPVLGPGIPKMEESGRNWWSPAITISSLSSISSKTCGPPNYHKK